MIAYLKGTLIHKTPGQVTSRPGASAMPRPSRFRPTSSSARSGRAVELFIHTHLTDNSLALYGFVTREEKDMFLKLIGISGIGPKLAMNVLSGIEPDALAEAVRTSDVARISLVPGIGKKTALRITMELQDKLEKKEKLLSAKASPEKGGPPLRPAEHGLPAQRGRAGRRPDPRRPQARRGIEKLLRECLKRLAKL